MHIDVGIIGGTGIGSRLQKIDGTAVHVPTPYGLMRCRIIEHRGVAVAAVSRHSAGHSVPPHLVNYRAIAVGLKALGARFCLSTAAVGGMREEWPVGSFAVCTDFLDFTGRNLTLFDRRVHHTDFSHPFDPAARQALADACDAVGCQAYSPAVYVNGNGPRYETPEEITFYRECGGDVVGMTAASEAIAMGEAGIRYGCLAVVTNFACGIMGVPLAHEEVAAEMERVGEKAVSVLLRAAESLGKKQ